MTANETVILYPPIDDDPPILKTGDYVIIIRGEEDVFDGQLCCVLDPREAETSYTYQPDTRLPVLCWTGYMVWTGFDNLVKVTANPVVLESLFRAGRNRSGHAQITF